MFLFELLKYAFYTVYIGTLFSIGTGTAAILTTHSISYFNKLNYGIYALDKDAEKEEESYETPFEELYKIKIYDEMHGTSLCDPDEDGCDNDTSEHDISENTTTGISQDIPSCNRPFTKVTLPDHFGIVYMFHRILGEDSSSTSSTSSTSSASLSEFEHIETRSNSGVGYLGDDEKSVSENDTNKTSSVIMNKDVDICFEYYASSSNIPYKYLDTICRMHVLENGLVDKYNVNYTLPEICAEYEQKENGVEQESDVDNTKHVPSVSQEEDEGESIKKTPEQKSIFGLFARFKKNEKEKEERQIVKKINYFKYCGNLNEAKNVLYTPETRNEKEDTMNKQDKLKTLSYSEYLSRSSQL